jgi:hypothetical protein
MKEKTVLLLMIMMLVIFSCKNKPGTKTDSESTEPAVASQDVVTETPSFHKYGIKSGIVTFETDMMDIKIKSVLYFDDYGTKEADEKYKGEEVESITICDGKERYNVIPSQKTAFSSGTCSRGIAYRFAWDEIATEDQGTKAKKSANMTIAGKDCESFTYDLGSSFSVYAGWQNICLYLKTTTGGTDVIMKAIKIEENSNIPAEKFQLPSGYEVKKAGAF